MNIPNNAPTYDPKNLTKTVKELCDYARSLQEQLDFQLGQIQKRLNELEKRQGG